MKGNLGNFLSTYIHLEILGENKRIDYEEKAERAGGSGRSIIEMKSGKLCHQG